MFNCLIVHVPTLHTTESDTYGPTHCSAEQRCHVKIDPLPVLVLRQGTLSGKNMVYPLNVCPGALTAHGMLQLCLHQKLQTGCAALVSGVGTRVLPDEVRTCTPTPQ